MLVSRPSLLAAAALLSVTTAHAASPVIDHSEIKCLVVGKYRKMPAKFTPADVAQPRVYFRPEGVPSWYYVEMKPEDPLGHVGVLPKPTKALVQKHIEYYVEAASRDFDSGRTPEFAPVVVEKDGDCDRDLLPPLYSKNPPSAVFPSLPQGFAMGGAAAGIGTAAAVVGGGAAAAGAVVLATGGDDEPTTATSTSTTTTTSSTTSTTSTTTTTLPVGRFLSCQADVREGPVPLTVKFNAQAPGVFDYLWDFGDGGTSTQVNPSHTFTVPGVYQVTVRASNGALVDTCTRTVTALPAGFDLTVATVGSGTVSAPGIACPGDCSESYAAGAVVTLTATPVAGSAFLGWTGDCSGTTPSCAVTMSQARSVTARFQAAASTFPLTVTLAGAGTGSVSGTGIACGLDCTESYAAGSPVTLNAVATGGSSFAGFSGDCTGVVCNLTMDGPRNVIATFNPPAPTFTLTVTPAGTGTGTISGPGIACPGDCTETYPASTPVTLTAAPTGGSTFAGFSGDCTGTTCALTMNGPRNVTATFDAAVTTFPLTVAVAGTGTGTVTAPGINCPVDCTENYPAGTPVSLTATSTGGSTFAGWSGDCTGTTCNLNMNAPHSVTATFTAAAPTFTLTVSIGGTGGTGSITGTGIGCPSDCTETYTSGTVVVLNATPTGGSTFGGWTGDCSAFTGLTCTLNMTADRTAGVNFNATLVPLTVLLAGSGAGTVSGQGCTAPCTQNFPPGTPVTLTAMPNMGSNFTGWSGDCTGIGTCSLVMNAAHTVTATFDPAALLTLTVIGPATAGTSVVAFPPAQTCTGIPAPGNTCTVPFAMGAGATLVPSTAGGLVANWGGDCAGTPQGANCMLIMSVNRTANATFVPAPLTEASRTGSTVMSRLEAAGARLSATLNEAPLPPPSPGPSTWAVAPRAGDNRLDAQVQAGAAGTWRLELAGVAGLEKGSLRVLSGEVVSVGPDAVVFRLKGRAGERFSLGFTVR
jgi:PKD repeat protein